MGVRDSQGGRGVEALNQEPGLIVGGKIGRTDHPVKSSLVKPIPRGVQETLGRSIILDALKETEEAGLFLVKIAIAEIVDCNDSSDYLSSFLQKKETCLRVIPEKGVVSFVEKFFLPRYLRWNPVRILSVNPPWELDELSPVLGSQNSTQTIRS
jgi:hypothetical protein